MKLDEDEDLEARAFRYHFRCVLAAPLLAARLAIAAAAPGAGVDMIAVADRILADLRAAGWEPPAFETAGSAEPA